MYEIHNVFHYIDIYEILLMNMEINKIVCIQMGEIIYEYVAFKSH